MAKIYGNTVGAIKIIDESIGGIIEVQELPTENIDESAVYKIISSSNPSLLKAGTYRFNDVLDIDSNMGTFDFPFTVNNLNIPDTNITSLTCNKIIIGKDYSEEYFDFTSITYVSTTPFSQGEITTENVIVYMNGDVYGEVYNHFWIVDGIQTHTIIEDTAVDDTFGTWYIANTNYNDVNVGTSEDALYQYANGSWIKYIYTGDATATSAHILEGETAYVDGVKITGTIPTYGGESLPSLTTYTVEDNESGGQTYTITSSSYALEGDSTDGTTYMIGG